MPNMRTTYKTPHMIQSTVWMLVTKTARQATCRLRKGRVPSQDGSFGSQNEVRRRRTTGRRREDATLMEALLGGWQLAFKHWGNVGGLCGWRPACGAWPDGGLRRASRNAYACAAPSANRCA